MAYRKVYGLVLATAVLFGCSLELDPKEQTSATLAVQWDAPVERENGEQLFIYEIGGYELSYRLVGANEYQSLLIENGSTIETELPITQVGQYEVRIAAFDSNGLYSKFSDAVVLTAY